MNVSISNAEKMRRVHWSWAGLSLNVSYIHLTFFGPIFLLYLNELGMSKPLIGFLVGMVPLMDLMALFISPTVARVGFKRVFVSTWALRKFIMLAMLGTPAVMTMAGHDWALAYVAGVFLVFALFRSVAVTALGPWSQEFVPPGFRGKFTAVQSVIVMLSGAVTVGLAGWYLGDDPNLNDFIQLYGFAFFLGIASAIAYAQLPGGAPLGDATQAGEPGQPGPAVEPLGITNTFATLRDPQFRLVLLGAGLVTFAWTPVNSFLPLFMKEQIGLAANQIAYADAVRMGAGVASCFLWGWVADRYGGRPVMLIGLITLMLFPICLLLTPQGSVFSFAIVMAIYAALGAAMPGWAVGYQRLLYVQVIPDSARSGYNAMHTAMVGLTSGLSPMLAGQMLHLAEGQVWSLGAIAIDGYSVLLLAAILQFGVALALLKLIHPDQEDEVTLGRLAGMFLQGNPISALGAVFRLARAGDEEQRVATIGRLGDAGSPLSDRELVLALHDPSFNVRYEAILALARGRSGPELVPPLCEVLRRQEPDLAIAAAWALGRMGDPTAIPALRQAMQSDFPLLEARAARALGTLGDAASAPIIHDRLRSDSPGVFRVAYAAALGALGYAKALEDVLNLLETLESRILRMETALAAASMTGGSRWFVRLAQRLEADGGDALSGALLTLRSRLRSRHVDMDVEIEQAARAFGIDDYERGAACLSRIVRRVIDRDEAPPAIRRIMHVSMAAAARQPAERVEYHLLLLHALREVVRKPRR